MRFRHCLWTLLAALHLVVVVFGACQWLPERNRGPLARMILCYARLSAADSQYGFYAPEVGNECRARFLVQDNQGATWWDTFEQTKSPEARLRLGEIAVHAFTNGEAGQFPEFRKRLVKSWAAAMFTRHPSTVSLTVVVETNDMPTMSEYRAGLRPSWKILYQAEVQRPSPVSEGIEP